MSHLLDAVREGRDLRDATQAAFVQAVRRAKVKHSYREVADAAGMTRSGIQRVLRPRGKEEK